MRGSYTPGLLKVAIWAVDDQANGTGWVETGSGNAGGAGGPVAPAIISVTPSTAATASQAFSATIRDPNGFATISRVYFLVNSTPNVPSNTCHGFYDRGQNAVFLYIDGLIGLAGPLVPGSATVIQNSQCALSGTGLSVSGSGTDLALALEINKKVPFLPGGKNLYFRAVDQDNLGTGWQQGATWPAAVNRAPTVDSGTPGAAAGSDQTFTVTVSDADAATDVNRVYFVLHTAATVPVNSCPGFYERASNRIYLYNDAVTQLVSNAVQPGVSGTIQNSQCRIDGELSSVTTAGTTLTLGIRFSKLGSFIGTTKNIYWWAVDNAATGTGWVATGVWGP